MKFKSGLALTAGFTVAVFLMGAHDLFSDKGPAHKKRLPRPIKLGSSGGNVNDRTSQFCCSGTLGAVVMDEQGNKYILSNNHVMARNNKGKPGDPISQPGNIDAGCDIKDTDIVGHLTRFPKFKFGAKSNNKVDAAIAEVEPGKVSSTGFIIDVRNPGQPAEAELGMRVKKSGRTTGLRKGIVDVINFTVQVLIPNQCGSSGGRIARFLDQVAVADAPGGTPPPFIAGGDSGSLLVRDIGACPATIGLLFAGDNFGNAVANRIQNVLTALGAGMKMVGCGSTRAEAFDQNALTLQHPVMIQAAAVQNRHQDRLLSLPGVVGVGIGLAEPGSRELAIVVYTVMGTRSAEVPGILPERLENLPVRKKITGEFVAF